MKKFHRENKAISKGCFFGCFIMAAVILLSSFLFTHIAYVSLRNFMQPDAGSQRRHEFYFGYPDRYKKEGNIRVFFRRFKEFLDDLIEKGREFIVPKKYHLVFLTAAFAQDRDEGNDEEAPQFKIARYEDYPVGTVEYISGFNVYIISDEEGLYALSAECARGKGIIEKRNVGFLCRKNGALYRDDGRPYYIARKNLEWYKIYEDEEGNLVVDKEETVPRGEKFKK